MFNARDEYSGIKVIAWHKVIFKLGINIKVVIQDSSGTSVSGDFDFRIFDLELMVFPKYLNVPLKHRGSLHERKHVNKEVRVWPRAKRIGITNGYFARN